MALHFVTGNAMKFREVQGIISDVQQVTVDLPEIQSLDPKEIITAKLQAAIGKVSPPFAVEDVSFSIDGLGGLPGPLIKWFLKSLGAGGLADVALKIGNGKAIASAIVGLTIDGQKIEFFAAEIQGTIIRAPGDRGDHWDPIFRPNGYDKTFAELSLEQKNNISHRALAWRQVAKHLEKTR